MNTEELNVELDYFRDRMIQLTNDGTRLEQRKNSLSGAIEALEAAQDDQVPDDRKAAVLSLGKLLVRVALSPDFAIDDSDSELLVSILERGTLLQ